MVGTAWEVAATVVDPEIPVLTIEDLGVLRDVREQDGKVTVDLTPTYSGCPAIDAMRDDVRSALTGAGYDDVEVRMVLSPAWTTDWISEAGREKLRAYGIAPPRCTSGPAGELVIQFAPKSRAARADQTSASGQFDMEASIACPLCGSTNTTEISHFGSTACKSLHRCLDCMEPFDHFKNI